MTNRAQLIDSGGLFHIAFRDTINASQEAYSQASRLVQVHQKQHGMSWPLALRAELYW